jgi:hypothetical protein
LAFGLFNANLTLLDILTLVQSWDYFLGIQAYIYALGVQVLHLVKNLTSS